MVFNWLFGSGNQGAIIPIIDPKNQSIPVDGKPHHRTSHMSKGKDLMEIPRDTNCETCYDVLALGKEMSDNGPCLGARTGPNREYQWMSYQEVIDKVHQFGAGLIHVGNDPVKNKFVAIYSNNRPEWVISDFACQARCMIPVPLYDTLGIDACRHILAECEVATVICDNEEKIKNLVSLKPDLPQLLRVISINSVSSEVTQSAEAAGLKLETFDDILNHGKLNPAELTPPKGEDIFSICYTSGTTAKPKGVVLTHRSFILMIESIAVSSKPHFVLCKDDVHLSYLPLPHNFERTVTVMVMMKGVSIGFSSGDIKLLGDDLTTLRPTFFPTVPRLLNRMYDAVYSEVRNSWLKSTLLSWALSSKLKDVNKHIFRRDTIWDKLIFHKIQEKLGGRVRVIITGSAPLLPEVMSFLRCAFGCMITEGYGQTECGAGLTFTLPGNVTVGDVGPPLPGVHIKLVDVPEMNFFVKDNVGEVCAKTVYMMEGYYKQPEKTAETIDEDGWLHTGDVGQWTETGALQIVDRKKNVFKLSQGEYVAAEKIENVYRSSPFVGQIYVDGNSLKPCLMAVVVPDDVFLEKWAPNNNFPSKLKEFCESEGAKKLIFDDMQEHAKKAGLMSFEMVKDIYLEHEMFSVQNEMLTPTMKNKRPTLGQKYKPVLEQLYAQNGL